MLARRADWALSSLRAGRLLLPSTYVILQLEVIASLGRRAGRLRPGHPWSHPTPLGRLQQFYTGPAAAVACVSPALAAALALPDWRYVCGHRDPRETLRLVRELAGAP